MGTAAVTDGCTTVGPELTNPILALPPGVLTTWRPAPFGVEDDDTIIRFIGDVWSPDDAAFELMPNVQYTAPLDVNHLACPTWGLGLSTATNGTIFTTVGPPWLPLIQPPIEMFSLNPTWAAICTAINNNIFLTNALDLFDPPFALTPAPLLLPTPLPHPASKPAPAPADPTSVPEQAKTSGEAAKPASLPNDPAAPAKTGNPGKNTPAQSPDIASPDPARSANLPENPVAPSKSEGDPPIEPPSDPSLDPSSDLSSDPSSDLSSAPSSNSKVPVVPLPQPVGDPQTQAQGLGAIIYNAFGEGGPQPDGSSYIVLPPQSVFAAGAQSFTANPTGFKVNGAAVTPGGAAQEVDGTIVSLNKAGILAIGSSTVSLTNPPASPVLAVAGQTFTPNPSAFSIAGTTISADGPAVTVSGTIISLGQHGALKIGSSTINLPTLSNVFPSEVYTVAGQVFTPNPSAFSIAGTTISAGGPAATVNGTVISLDPSGTLVIGSSTIPLLPQTVSSSSVVDIDGFDAIAHSSFVVVDGVTVSAAAAGITVSGRVVSLEAGGAALDIGTGHFVLPTPVVRTNGSVNVQAFVGGQSKGLSVSVHLVWGVYGALMLLIWYEYYRTVGRNLVLGDEL